MFYVEPRDRGLVLDEGHPAVSNSGAPGGVGEGASDLS
jgi:hypothetical protein